ncbi:protein yellow-like [Cloeon dipterum]|uniref:protein yellow-like n=1 Tax=Cloeon dipterum TaxID=197152 RepID=UPI00321FEEE0
MAWFSFLLFLLSPFAVCGLNFSTVFVWEQLNFNWPSHKNSFQTVYEPNNILTYDHAVFRERIFISFYIFGVPVTLTWLSMTEAQSREPKLRPFPSWTMHEEGGCEKIKEIKGLEVDPVGRLWALDRGTKNCAATKLWIFDLANNDSVVLVHQFAYHVAIHDLSKKDMREFVLDETPDDDWLAYIPDFQAAKIVVFSLKRNTSWTVKIEKVKFSAFALSPKINRGLLYLADQTQTEVHTAPISSLRRGDKKVNPYLVGNKTEGSRRMLMDSRGKLYFDLERKGCIATWDTNADPFLEEVVYQKEELKNKFPFSFAFDTCNNLWLLIRNGTKYQLLRAAVGARSYLYNDSDVLLPACGKRDEYFGPEFNISGPSIADKRNATVHGCDDRVLQNLRVLNVVLSCWNVFSFFSIGFQIFWFRFLKRKNKGMLAKAPEKFQEIIPDGEVIYEEVEPSTSV